jgi:hypothetical protein
MMIKYHHNKYQEKIMCTTYTVYTIYGGGSMFGVEKNAIKNTYLLLPLRRPLLVGI